MNPQLLKLLQASSSRTTAELANATGMSETDVTKAIAAAEAAGLILGYQAVVDQTKMEQRPVTALIEVKIGLAGEEGQGLSQPMRA